MGNDASSEGRRYEHVSNHSSNLNEEMKHVNTYTADQLQEIWDTDQVPEEDVPKLYKAARKIESVLSMTKRAAHSLRQTATKTKYKIKPCGDDCPYTNADAQKLESLDIASIDSLHLQVAHPDLYEKLQRSPRRLRRFRSDAQLPSLAQIQQEEEQIESQKDKKQSDHHEYNGNEDSNQMSFVQQQSLPMPITLTTPQYSVDIDMYTNDDHEQKMHYVMDELYFDDEEKVASSRSTTPNFLKEDSQPILVRSPSHMCADAEACDLYKELCQKYRYIQASEPEVDERVHDHCLQYHVEDFPEKQCDCKKWQKDSIEAQHLMHGHWFHQHTLQQLRRERQQREQRKASTVQVIYDRSMPHSMKRVPRNPAPSQQDAFRDSLDETPKFIFGAPFRVSRNEAAFKNPKEEILGNTYKSLKVALWNALLRKCILYAKTRHALSANFNVKEIVALKLYTDYDDLQAEYRKCFRDSKAVERQRQFYHWHTLLVTACNKSRDTVTDPIYHGVSDNVRFSTFVGTYYGPVSTTTVYRVAQQFAGQNGQILELYPSFGKRGLRVNWLSNFPDEEEILYMNTTFQIRNIYTADINESVTQISPRIGGLNAENAPNARKEFEKVVLHAIQSMNRDSVVISLNTSSKWEDEKSEIKEDDTSGFVELSSKTQLAVLYLLYLQYRQDEWNAFAQKSDPNVRRAFTAFRKEFVLLADNVKAVKMERLSKALQVFFYSDQRTYRFPIDLYDDKSTKTQTKGVLNFRPNQPFRIETIVRLFPNAEQISINANNWDFSLNTFIAWLQTFDMDYAKVKLQDIYIKFTNKQKIDGSNRVQYKIVTDDERAKLLFKREAGAKAKKQLTTLRKLGWQLMTTSHLHRVGFEPAPELPFVMAFVRARKSTIFYYRSYSMQFTSEQVRSFGNGQNAEPEPEPGAPPIAQSKTKAATEPGRSMSETKDTPMDELEGSKYVVIHHNPANCILSRNIFDTLQYKDKLIEALELRKENCKQHGANYEPKNKQEATFVKLCETVKTLVLDPMPKELQKIFMEYKKDNMYRGIISFETIYQMFPNVEEMFLRNTTLTLRICYKLRDFERKYKQNHDQELRPKLKRVFFKNNEEISDAHVMRYQLVVGANAWEVVKSVSMLQKY